MARFWVVGGEYETTNFKVIKGGGEEERFGPFDTSEAARVKWADLAMKTVDHAHIRYRIEADESTHYWVVGGIYRDTAFNEIAPGHEKERVGPFDSEAEALDIWREKSWEHVDNAFAQYRVERIDEPAGDA